MSSGRISDSLVAWHLTKRAYIDFITPEVTLILSFFLLGEDLSLARIAGLILVILGVLLVIKKE